jgi:hypothetical protein
MEKMIRIEINPIKKLMCYVEKMSCVVVLAFLFSCAYAQEIETDGFYLPGDANSVNTNQGRWLFFEIRKSNELKGYMFGASHTLVDAKALPRKIRDALQGSNTLVYEANYFDEGLKEEGAKILTSNPSEKTLDRMLLPQTYEKLQELYKFENIPSEAQSKMNLWSPYMAITVLDMKCTTIQMKGIFPESIIDNFAKRSGMKILGLETVNDQLGWLSQVSMSQWDDYFTAYENWIKDDNCSEKFASSYKKVSTDVVKGDAESIFDEYMRFYSQDIPVKWFHEQYFLVARNIPLSEKMVKILQSGQTPFFLMGAAHLGGASGLITLLQKKGYQVIQQ